MFVSTILLYQESFSWSEWVLRPDFMIGWLLFGAAYLLFSGPLRPRFSGSHPLSPFRLASFGAGMLLVLIALQSPLTDLANHFLFSAHMVQHLLLLLLVPPLLLLAIPGWMLRPLLRVPGLHSIARLLTRPLTAFLLLATLFGVWHLPAPYDLMMRDPGVHSLVHLMVMATGIIVWWPVMSPLPELPRIAGPLQMLYLFALGIPMMIVSVIIAFSGTHFYPWYAEAPRLFGLTVMDDQRLGALIMSVPGAFVIWVGITFTYFRWTRREIREDEQAVGISKPGESGIVISPPPFPGNG